MAWVSEVSLEFLDERGLNIGKLLIAAEKNRTAIEVLTSEKAQELGEEVVQLREGQSYEYELKDAKPGLHLQESEVVIRSSILNESAGIDRGRITPGSHTGLLPLILEDQSNKRLTSILVEVQSSKLGYRDEYRQMMNFIADKCVGILMDIRSPSETRFVPDPGSDTQTIQQRFAFLKAILDTNEFHNALQRITTIPHQRLEEENYEREIRRGFKPDRTSQRQIVNRIPRISLPPNHPLYARMGKEGYINPSLPANITTSRNRETIDTPENRFVKHTLTTYIDFLFQLEKRLVGKSSAEQRLRREVLRLQEILEIELSKPFFREISEPIIAPLGSPVLQRKAGYQEILQAWLKFNLAGLLIWSGGNDVYGAGKRDMDILYEYWLFFQLLELFTTLFEGPRYNTDSLIEVGADGFSLKLKAGKQLTLVGSYTQGSRPLHVRFSYNQVFANVKEREDRGSWTQNMRPDFTFSFWPESFSSEEAERQELMVHIHFDAKYRAEAIQDLFGINSVDLQSEKEEEKKGNYKRADLLKMHAYRDAIHRSEGAYVLYPGSNEKLWSSFHEILPSLGAFAVRPSEEGKAKGLENVVAFIQQVINLLCDRTARRERVSYHLYHIGQASDPIRINYPIPEFEAGTHSRAIPPAEHWILVGSYENFMCLRWILQKSLYVFQMELTSSSSHVQPEFTLARHLLLYNNSGVALKGLLQIKELGFRLLTSENLAAMEYPGTLVPRTIYAVYSVASDIYFKGFLWKWDLTKLNNEIYSKAASFPFAITLEKALSVRA